MATASYHTVSIAWLPFQEFRRLGAHVALGAGMCLAPACLATAAKFCAYSFLLKETALIKKIHSFTGASSCLKVKRSGFNEGGVV